LPKTDAEVEGRHDVALLRLKQPAGMRLAYASLASPAYQYSGPRAVLLVSSPYGTYEGLEHANLKKIRNLSARWAYDIKASAPGSSGGGCFDTSFGLAGIHQGRAGVDARLVPLIRFDTPIRDVIAKDETPSRLWSLDGTPDSPLVVGREALFLGYHAAMRGPERVRGVWTRRADPREDVAGLSFAFELLDRLAGRSPGVKVVRVSFDAPVPDLPAEIARRALQVGIEVESPQPRAGVAVDQTEPEAVAADRGRRLAQALDDECREGPLTLWVFFDHPAVAFGDESRWALAAFVDQAVRLARLRIFLAGYEAVQFPGEVFNSSIEAEGEGAPGLMVEYVSDVRDHDVSDLIWAAARDMDRHVDEKQVAHWTKLALDGLPSVNRRYDSQARAEIAARLQPLLKQLRDTGAPA
jgi:hypothetical protein